MSTSDERLARFKAGDEEAWREVVADAGPWLVRLGLRLTGDPALAEDLAQEAFVRAWRSRRQLRRWDALNAWLRTTLTRLWLRRARREAMSRGDVSLEAVEAFLPDSPAESPERQAAAREELTAVLAALQTLSPRQRACLTLAVFDGLSMKDIARTLGISGGAVRKHIFEARRKLKEELR